jgi:hypothetical protein
LDFIFQECFGRVLYEGLSSFQTSIDCFNTGVDDCFNTGVDDCFNTGLLLFFINLYRLTFQILFWILFSRGFWKSVVWRGASSALDHPTPGHHTSAHASPETSMKKPCAP